MIPIEIIKQVPKVELHDHLDGSMRPSTIIELAQQQHITLPSEDPVELEEWFHQGCERKSLPLYLETFSVTVSVLQTTQALKRAAFETLEDLAKDNVVYAEIRFAPILHTAGGLTMEEVVEAVLDGMDAGKRKTGISYGVILCALRNQNPSISLAVAKLVIAYRSRGVVALDLAGDEQGNPPKIHLEAFQYIRNQNGNITIHAGEGFGLESIWQAIQVCGAHRIGHGTRLIDDMDLDGTRIEKMGSLAHFIQDKRIPIEMCLSSNVGTGAAKDFASHPFYAFYKNNYRVFLSTDNRLMSNTTLTKEMNIAAVTYNLNLKDLEKITVNAMKSAFIHHDERINIIFNIIKKRYAQLRKEYPQYI
jgi:adenosine deaminase